MESYNLTEAYLEIYEAKVDKNLSPMEKEKARNIRTFGSSSNRATGVRRTTHEWERGPKERELPTGNEPTTLNPRLDSRVGVRQQLRAARKRKEGREFAKRVKSERESREYVRRANSKYNADNAENKIVRLNREEYEYLISYLLDEGYASDISSAESIYDSMSEGWKTDVLKSTLKTTGKVLKGGAKIMNNTGLGKKVRKFATRTALGAVGIPMISE